MDISHVEIIEDIICGLEANLTWREVTRDERYEFVVKVLCLIFHHQELR